MSDSFCDERLEFGDMIAFRGLASKVGAIVVSLVFKRLECDDAVIFGFGVFELPDDAQKRRQIEMAIRRLRGEGDRAREPPQCFVMLARRGIKISQCLVRGGVRSATRSRYRRDRCCLDQGPG